MIQILIITRGLEVAWVASALIGAAIGARNLREAVRDEQYLIARDGDWARRIVARMGVRRAWVQVVSLGTFAALGIVLLAESFLVDRGIPPAVIVVSVLFAFCCAVIQMSVLAVLDARDRHALLRQIAR